MPKQTDGDGVVTALPDSSLDLPATNGEGRHPRDEHDTRARGAVEDPDPDGLRAERDHWRERAIVWRERAIAAELVANILQKNVADLRASLHDLRGPDTGEEPGRIERPAAAKVTDLATTWRRRTAELWHDIVDAIRPSRA
jgi:hypothetical protein